MGKNDTAWEILFERHDIIDNVRKNGHFYIKASEIKTVREPRLMCKFDHRTNLPELFAKNQLAILPVSRSEYVIGSFDMFKDVKYQPALSPTRIGFPSYLQSLRYSELHSESVSLHAAHVAGMFSNLMEDCKEPFIQTVSGRMGSGAFQFQIHTAHGLDEVTVAGSQIEVDGGYESQSVFLLLEAKKERVTDFNIRQLYYPYRVWKKKLKKPVIPVFFTHSTDIFSFFVYEFREESVFNSISLVAEKHFIIDDERITMEDMKNLADSAQTVVEDERIPFPQANNFERVVDLLGLLYENDLSKEDITTNYNFTDRQTDYYTNIGRYLQLVDKYRGDDGIYFQLNNEGRRILSLPFKQKYLALITKVFEHAPFKLAFQEWMSNGYITPEKVVDLMKKTNVNVQAESTYHRRAQSLIAWINWIKKRTEL